MTRAWNITADLTDLFKATAERMRAPDLLQALVGYLALLSFVLMVSWPTTAERVNNAWYALTQANILALSLAGLSFGSSVSERSSRTRLTTLLALLGGAVLSLPLEVGAYAAAFPSVPLGWPLALLALDTVALFGLGMGLGGILTVARLRFLLPLIVPLLLLGMFAFDIWIGVPLLNPFTAVIALTPLHLLSTLPLITLALVLLTRAPSPERTPT